MDAFACSVCIASIVRVISVEKVDIADPTWTAVEADIWSTVEPCIAIVSACLPMMAPLLKAMVPKRLIERVKSPFRSLSSFGSSIRREKERNRDIALVEREEGGEEFEMRNGSERDKGSVSAEVYEV